MAAAAITETTKRNWNAFCVAVVNPSGDLVYFEKQDNCQYASIGISQHKARTAARYRRPTLVFETLISKGPYFAFLTTLDDVIASRGGNPLMVDGKVVGAIQLAACLEISCLLSENAPAWRRSASRYSWARNRMSALPIVDVDKSAEICGLILWHRKTSPLPFYSTGRRHFVFVIEPVTCCADVFIERP